MDNDNTAWANLVKELRQYAFEHIIFPDESIKESARILMFETDEFHPFDFDKELDGALKDFQNKVDDEQAKEEIYIWIDECICNVLDFFINPYNFPPSMFKTNINTIQLETVWEKEWPGLRNRIYTAIGV